MERFVRLTAHGLLEDASRWLMHVQELWGVHVHYRLRAGGEPRLGSFDALSRDQLGAGVWQPGSHALWQGHEYLSARRRREPFSAAFTCSGDKEAS